MKMKKGFTLSEVLITLTLIGVITALVVPSIVSSTNFTQKIATVKKAYNTISNAYTQAVVNSEFSVMNLQTLMPLIEKNMSIKYYLQETAGENGGSATYTRTNTHGVETTTAGSQSNWFVTEDGIGYRIKQIWSSKTCGRAKMTINCASRYSSANACYEIDIDIDGPDKGEQNDAEVTLDGNKKIKTVDGARFKAFISSTGVTTGNATWSPLAKIMEAKE